MADVDLAPQGREAGAVAGAARLVRWDRAAGSPSAAAARPPQVVLSRVVKHVYQC